MYGVGNDIYMIEIMERRIKEKIYREMLEEYERYKKIANEERITRRKYDSQTKNGHQYEQGTQKRTNGDIFRDSNQNAPLSHGSNFLPVLDYNQKFEEKQESSRNQEYQDYLRRRRYRQANKQYERIMTQGNVYDIQTSRISVEDSDDQKAHFYLNQCQQIISGQCQSTQKQKKKMPQRKNRYKDQVQEVRNSARRSIGQYHRSFEAKPPSSLKFFKQGSSYKPLADSRNGRINLGRSTILQQNQNQKQPINKNFIVKQTKISENDSALKIKENTHSISPTENNQERLKNDQHQDIYQKNKSSSMDSSLKLVNKQIALTKSKLQDRRLGIKAEQNEELKQNQESQKQQKKQKAILKYLKKAKLRGKILFQKIQSFKRQGGPDQIEEKKQNK